MSSDVITSQGRKTVTIIAPAHNEAENLAAFYQAVVSATINLPYAFTILFINDGSDDDTQKVIERLAKQDPQVCFIEFSRNFGKEAATTAGIHAAHGDVCIIIDTDLQHPPSAIPTFLAAWEQGAEIVIGMRIRKKSGTWIKRTGASLFYHIMYKITNVELLENATDFRLLDRVVIDAFKELHEYNRITRGLTDWLGFHREFVYFEEQPREHGTPSYNISKLINLAITSIISLSLWPLRLGGMLGIAIMVLSGILGFLMIIDRYIHSFGLNFSGSAILANIILFLVGLVLIFLGVLAYYIGHIYTEVQRRPLYVIRKRS